MHNDRLFSKNRRSLIYENKNGTIQLNCVESDNRKRLTIKNRFRVTKNKHV